MCRICGYANDTSFRFCQSCGEKNTQSICATSQSTLQENIYDQRLRYLDTFVESSSYGKKKSALHKELENFLACLSKGIKTATPDDIRMFLVHKDSKGKTQIHDIKCKNVGKTGHFDCGCPVRLAWGTVQSIIGQLKSIFEGLGKGKLWDETAFSGNPLASIKIGKYLEAIQKEQAISHVAIKQAKPLFLDILKLICQHLHERIQEKDISLKEKYVFLRDKAFFKLQFFAGDRAGDLGKCLVQEVKRLPNGKTLKHGKVNDFTVMRLSDNNICFIVGLEKYVFEAKRMGIDLTSGYLFRPVDPSGKQVLELPLSTPAVYARLKLYLRTLGIDEGETPHGLRGGCAVTLAFSGCGNSRDIMDHVGWFSKESFLRYSRIGSLVDSSCVSNMFKQVANSDTNVKAIFDDFGEPNKLPFAF